MCTARKQRIFLSSTMAYCYKLWFAKADFFIICVHQSVFKDLQTYRNLQTFDIGKFIAKQISCTGFMETVCISWNMKSFIVLYILLFNDELRTQLVKYLSCRNAYYVNSFICFLVFSLKPLNAFVCVLLVELQRNRTIWMSLKLSFKWSILNWIHVPILRKEWYNFDGKFIVAIVTLLWRCKVRYS